MSHALATLLLDPRLRLATAEALAMPAGDRFPVRVGRIHEWFLAGDFSIGRFWCPPLTVMAALACQATRNGAGNRRIAWIGRRCRPTFQLLAALGAGAPAGRTLARSIFLEPLNDAERFWAIGQALRCPGVGAVIADGSGMSPTVSRRLQLAAECGMVMGLIARPPWEMGEPSYAATRWQVQPAAADGGLLRWMIERLSCRGQQQGHDAPQYWTADWLYQVFRGTGIFHLSPDMGRGSAASQVEEPGGAAGGERGGQGGEWGGSRGGQTRSRIA
jgi:hypothetical protein